MILFGLSEDIKFSFVDFYYLQADTIDLMQTYDDDDDIFTVQNLILWIA